MIAHRWGLGAAMLAATVALPVDQAAPAADGDPVRVCGRVTGGDRISPGALTPLDFVLQDDGAPRDILSVTHAPPIAVMLLFDISPSMTYFPRVTELFRETGRKLDARDRVGVGSFANDVVIGAMTAPDAIGVETGREFWQRRSSAAPPSPLWDAINASLSVLDGQHGRRALIVVTDGQVTGNLTRYERVEAHALASQVEVSLLVQGMPRDRRQMRPEYGLRYPWERPDQLARATGGLTFSDQPALGSADQDSFNAAILNAIDGLKQEHCLTFRPAVRDNRFHTLHVGIRRGGATARWATAFLAK